MLWLLAYAMKSLKIRAERIHSQPSDMFRQVEPVRANIGHATRRPAGFDINAPVPVRVVQQPVLEIRALHDKNFTQLASFAQRTHLLNHGIEAQVVTNAVAQSPPECKRNEL